MDYNQLRNLMAPMKRGDKLILPHVEYILEVTFSDKGVFSLDSSSKVGKSAGHSGGYSSLSEFTNQIMYFYEPKPGHAYQHLNGNIYEVLHIANEYSLRDDYPPSVVYQGANGNVWVKPLTNFIRKMTRIK